MKNAVRMLGFYAAANLIFLAVAGGCGQTSAKDSDGTGSGSTDSSGCFAGPGSGSFPSGTGGPGGGARAAQGGFTVSLSFADGTKTSDVQATVGGFRISCEAQDVVVTKLELKLKVTKAADSSIEETSAKFDSKCIGPTTISATGLATSDKAELTVNEIDTAGKTTMTGTTAEYTQAAQEQPTAGSGTSGTGRPSAPTLPAVDITMAAPEGSGSGSASGSGT